MMIINIANLDFRSALRKRSKTDMIILHHAAAQGGVEAVHRYHKNNLGWSGIGYNYYVRKDGTVWEGRGLDKVGAHAGASFNNRSVGICAEGNFETETMLRTETGAHRTRGFCSAKISCCVIKGHREVAATACPEDFIRIRRIELGEEYKGKSKNKVLTPSSTSNSTDRRGVYCVAYPQAGRLR